MTKQRPRETLTVRTSIHGNADYWHYTFERGGWAIFTINEVTGEFAIQSDWGNYSYRWSMGPGVPNKNDDGSIDTDALKKFLARAGADYVTTKLSYDMPRKAREEFDMAGFRSAIRELLCRTRRDEDYITYQKRGRYGEWERVTERFTKEWARAAWDELDEVCDRAEEYHHDGQTTALMENWPASLNWIDDVWDYFSFKPTARFVFLQETLLPFFQEQLRAQFQAVAA